MAELSRELREALLKPRSTDFDGYPILTCEKGDLWITRRDLCLSAEYLGESQDVALQICARCVDQLVYFKFAQLEKDKAKEFSSQLTMIASSVAAIERVLSEKPLLNYVLTEFVTVKMPSHDKAIFDFLNQFQKLAQVTKQCAQVYGKKYAKGRPNQDHLVILIIALIRAYEAVLSPKKVGRQTDRVTDMRVLTPFEKFVGYWVARLSSVIDRLNDNEPKEPLPVSDRAFRTALVYVRDPVALRRFYFKVGTVLAFREMYESWKREGVDPLDGEVQESMRRAGIDPFKITVPEFEQYISGIKKTAG